MPTVDKISPPSGMQQKEEQFKSVLKRVFMGLSKDPFSIIDRPIKTWSV
jgi:hypothetical protein